MAVNPYRAQLGRNSSAWSAAQRENGVPSRPVPLDEAGQAVQELINGDVVGKLVLVP